LHQKDGISLVNGTQFSTALAIKSLSNGINLLDAADSIGSLSVETSLSSRDTFSPGIHKLKMHKGQIISAKNVWNMTSESEIVKSHKDCEIVQDPYSFRCIPHIHGACRDALYQSSETINKEINSVSDNPLILSKSKVGFSGHFHAEHIAISLDHMAIAIAEIGAISERRIHYFMKGAEGRFQPFLAKNPGLESGYMLAHVTASALASENKTLAHPASVDSIPTSGGQEDLVSMAPWAGSKLLKIQDNVSNILAIELLIAGAAFKLNNSKLKPGKGTGLILKHIKHIIRSDAGDRELSSEINSLKAVIDDGKIFEKLKNKGYLE
jgi:histidine ammonia-lyase